MGEDAEPSQVGLGTGELGFHGLVVFEWAWWLRVPYDRAKMGALDPYSESWRGRIGTLSFQYLCFCSDVTCDLWLITDARFREEKVWSWDLHVIVSENMWHEAATSFHTNILPLIEPETWNLTRKYGLIQNADYLRNSDSRKLFVCERMLYCVLCMWRSI